MASSQSQMLVWTILRFSAKSTAKELSLNTHTSLPCTYNFLSKSNVLMPHVPCNQNSTLPFVLPQITLKPRDKHGSSWARRSNPSALITSHHSHYLGLELKGCCPCFLPCFNSFLFWTGFVFCNRGTNNSEEHLCGYLWLLHLHFNKHCGKGILQHDSQRCAT